MAERQREQRFERRMIRRRSPDVERREGPWLNPSGANVTILDRPIDLPRFRRRMANAVAQVPRLRERRRAGTRPAVAAGVEADPEFDFDYHLRHLALPPPGDRRQLLDLVSNLYEDPFDRTRPLWVFYVIDGLERGRSALFFKLHHSLSDGIGVMRLAELYMEAARGSPMPPEVDLDAVIAESLEAAKVAAREEDSLRAATTRRSVTPGAASSACCAAPPARSRCGEPTPSEPGHGRGRGADGAKARGQLTGSEAAAWPAGRHCGSSDPAGAISRC